MSVVWVSGREYAATVNENAALKERVGQLEAGVAELEIENAHQAALLTEFRASHAHLCRITGLPEQREAS